MSHAELLETLKMIDRARAGAQRRARPWRVPDLRNEKLRREVDALKRKLEEIKK